MFSFTIMCAFYCRSNAGQPSKIQSLLNFVNMMFQMVAWSLVLLSWYYLLVKKAKDYESFRQRQGLQAVVTHTQHWSRNICPRNSVLTIGMRGKEKVQVAVRARPPLPRETLGGKFTSCLGIGPTTGLHHNHHYHNQSTGGAEPERSRRW